MLHPDLEKLIRDAWALVASQMGTSFLELSWVKGPTPSAALTSDTAEGEDLPLAA
jgi:hypothetical protein